MRKKGSKRHRGDEEGFILITVLLVIGLLFPLVLAFNSRVQVNLLQAANFRNSIQALRMARAGVEGALGILKIDNPASDSRRDTWGMQFPPLAAGDGMLSVKIVDEDGKIPVNALVAANGNDVNRDVDARLRALITRLGGNAEIVDALIDWLDANDEVTGAAGAEEEYYREKGYHCRNGPLGSLQELMMIRGFDRELVVDGKMTDYLTVAETDGKVNINTAPIPVLHTVLGTATPTLAAPLSEGDIEDIGQYREEHDFINIKDIERVVKISAAQSGNIAPLIKVNSSFFTVTSKYTIDKVTKHVEALLKRDGNNVTVISWREF